MLDVDLAKSMREAEMRGLMMQLHANFEARIASEGWSRLLLPQVSEAPQHPKS